MNTLDSIIINVHKIIENPFSIVSSIRHEMDPNTKEHISRTYFSPQNVSFNIPSGCKLTLNYQRYETDEQFVKCLKLEDNESVLLISPLKDTLNIPTMIRCQNCETNFPTKYQYQRHQCEFNAEKVVLKPDVDIKDMDKGVKYICRVCDKQFVSQNNLERHEASHGNNQENICEYCNKHFVSENRLRIHKENHCKKAGDISKFYRSDVTVWKCKKCHEVFSSAVIASYHSSMCTETQCLNSQKTELDLSKGSADIASDEGNSDNSNGIEDRNIEKVLTELLLQCEFCNRTYSEKNLLLKHQRQHTTAKNYECTNCYSIFDSYATAAQHWVKKCTEHVSVFFLPKFTYCEYCDRTFKSHELLYTHKIKKKHYTSKFHVPSKNNQASSGNVNKEKPIDNKEILNKLIEDVLKTLDVPVNKLIHAVHPSNDECNKENIDTQQTQLVDESSIKTEEEVEGQPSEEFPEKKKRGRKRKLTRNQCIKLKKFCAEVEEGFKYQCERCIKVLRP